MKLRRNMLQPLRLEIDQRHPSPMASPHHSTDQDCDSISSRLRNAFETSNSLHFLRFDARPSSLLQEYSEQRQDSIAGNLFRTANRIHASVDTVVVLSLGNAALGAKAIAQACCQPFWNHLSRADRGSKPRMFFIDDHSDNDTIQGVLHLLGCHRPTTSNFDLDRWGLLVLATDAPPHHPSPTETQTGQTWQLEAVLRALRKHVANDESEISQRLMAVAPTSGAIAKKLSQYGSYDFFPSEDEPPAFQCFGPLGLLPATLLGVNIMELLAGASWMSQHFHQTDPADNLVLRLMTWLAKDGTTINQTDQFRIWSPSLRGWQEWYRDLWSTSKDSVPASHSHESPQVHASHSSRSSEINLVVERPRFDPIELGVSGNSQEQWIASIMQHLQSSRGQGLACGEIRMAELDELHTGQLMQFTLLLSTSCRMLGWVPPAASGLRFEADDRSEDTACP